MDKNTIQSIFATHFPFWKGLSEADREYLLSNSAAKVYKKRETIHDGNECTGVILINKGELRVYMLSEEGKEFTLYRLYDSDLCMLSASCVMETITFDVLVDASVDTECVIIPGPTFSYLADKNPGMKIFSLETTTARFSDAIWSMQQILFMSIEKRLAIFLYDEITKNGSDTVRLTQEIIAKYMGSAREVISRTLKLYSEQGIVELIRGGIKILDKRKLRSLAV